MMRAAARAGVAAAATVFVLLSSVAIQAQPAEAPKPTTSPAGKAKPQSGNTVAPQAAPAPPPLQTSVEQALYLIRSTLMTLNDANRSGNYSVLRDLATPDFAARNSAADLAVIFAELRQRKFDLFAAAITPPQFTATPTIANGTLRLVGFFPTRPQQIGFDLAYQSITGQWRLHAISVATPNAPVAETPAAAAKGTTPASSTIAGPPPKPR